MTLLKDELMMATGLSEEQLKVKLLKNPPEDGLAKAEQDVEFGGINRDSWAYITRCYMPSNSTIRDRMLKVVRRVK